MIETGDEKQTVTGGVDGAKAERAEHTCARSSMRKGARQPRCLSGFYEG